MPIRTKAQKARILVVTAEPQIQKLLKSIFMANGYRAFFAVEAAAAIQATPRFVPNWWSSISTSPI